MFVFLASCADPGGVQSNFMPILGIFDATPDQVFIVRMHCDVHDNAFRILDETFLLTNVVGQTYLHAQVHEQHAVHTTSLVWIVMVQQFGRHRFVHWWRRLISCL